MLRRTMPWLALLTLCCTSCASAAQKQEIRIDGSKYLTTDKLRRGMKGYGLTTFKGTKPERFGVEIIGVMHNAWGVGSDVILVRCSGQNLEQTGIAAGMSGSPIYVNGKLIGALAYAFAFARAPIAGVTPIAEMLPLVKKGPGRKARKAAAAVELKEPVRVFGRDFFEVKLSGRPAPRPATLEAIELCPIATPIRRAGLGPPRVARRLLREFAPQLEKVGLMPVQGGTAGAKEGKGAKLEPGATIGARLLWGDLNWDAIGTVTEIVGDRVLAFGHPVFSQPDLDIPMTTGYIYTIVPSFRRTFKMGSGLQIVGRFDTDRETGVAGTIGAKGRSVKIAVSVSGLDGDKTRQYNFEAVRHPTMTAMMAGMAVSGCLFRSGDPPEELAARYKITVVPEGRAPVVIENVESGWNGLGTAAQVYNEVRGALFTLTNNSFERVFPVSVSVEAKFERVRRYAAIESVALDSSAARRGQTLRATVELRHARGRRARKIIDVSIPRDAPLGKAVLQVCGGRACMIGDRKDAPGRFIPADIDGVLRLLRKQYRRDRIYVRLSYAGNGISFKGKELPDLPSSVHGVIASRRQTGLTKLRNTIVTSVPCGVVVTGSQLLKLEIEEEK